jgi:hypothetical protein
LLSVFANVYDRDSFPIPGRDSRQAKRRDVMAKGQMRSSKEKKKPKKDKDDKKNLPPHLMTANKAGQTGSGKK